MPKKAHSPKKDKFFSAAQVGTLIEGLRGDFGTFGEGLATLTQKVDAIAVNLASTMERMTMMEITARKILKDTAGIAAIREVVTSHGLRLAQLEASK